MSKLRDTVICFDIETIERPFKDFNKRAEKLEAQYEKDKVAAEGYAKEETKEKYRKLATEKFEKADPERDKEQIVNLYVDQYNMTQEQAEANFNGIINPPEGNYYYQPILREGEKIISRGLLYIPKDPKDATFRLLSNELTKYFDAYLANIIPVATEKGSENFELYLAGPTLEHLDFLKSYGFSVVNKVFTFTKEI